MSSQAEAASVLSAPVALPAASRAVVGDRLGERASERGLSPAASFSHLATAGAGYLAIRYGLGVLVSLGNMLVLTWWIGPHAYGVFVTAISLVAFLASLGRAGVDTYLVRRAAAPDARLYGIAATVILAVSAGLVLAGAGLAPLLVRWYGSREFVAPYLVLLCNLPIVGLTGVPTAKLERELNFRTVAGIELAGQAVGLVLSLVLALSGMGVWAPVGGQIAWQAFLLIAVYWAARLLPRLQFDWREAREMLSFGIGVSASMRAWQLRTLVNPLLVGRFAGAEGVAFVGLAIRIAEALGSVRLAAGRLAIAALARLQDRREEFRRALQRALFLQVMTLGPLLGGFALVGPLVVRHVIGVRWMPSLAVFPFIAAGVLVNSIYNLQASALFVMGRQWLVMRSYLTHVLLLGAGTLLLLPRLGITAYGWAELLACAAYFMIQAGLAKTAAISYRRLAPWLAIFLALVFAPALHNWTAALWLPMVGAATAWEWRQAPATKSLRNLFECQIRGRHLQRLRSFVAKARQRGWPYLQAVAIYSVRSRAYRLQLRLQRAIEISNRGQIAALRRRSWHRRRHKAGADGIGPVFHFNAADIPRIILSIPAELRRKTIARADAVMEQRFVFRGREQAFPGVVDWNACPNGNLSWQWDLNRHAFFLTLATSYYYTRDTRYLGKLAAMWTDWIERNPVGKGAAWTYPFEVAARLQNWIWAYFLLLYSGGVNEGHLDAIAAALRAHGTYLNCNLEYHWPNNHLLLEAKALYEYALLFPQYRETEKYLTRAGRALRHEVPRQVLPDGAHSELCSMYHRILAGELGELALLCRRNRRPLPSIVEQRVERLVEFSRALLREDGSMPLLGDSAMDDVQIRFDPARQDHSDLNYWLRQPEHEVATERGVGAAPELKIFSEAGYAFVRGGEGARRFHLTFDFGRVSRCPAGNHAHCDALSLELFAGGRALVIDPGVYLPWNDGERWARHFRSTAAHNTLVVDGREQSELCAYADVRQEAQTQLLGYSVSGDAASVSAECRPYWAADEHISHRREVCCHTGGTVRIRDQVVGSGAHHLEWSFHFAPGIDVREMAPGKLAARMADTKTEVFRMEVSGDPPSLRLARGETDPLRGWVARHSSEVLPAYTAVYSLKALLPLEIEFHFELTGEEPAESTPASAEEPVNIVSQQEPAPLSVLH
ncbi:MAG TPA: oligosaccharide flippase family protein [Terriglobales bacterium]|jgi:PST family polysaccharide transporter|nr:oligosaccharide flippase family protein [Terriglobales bacterium]